jgi:hypothetical protein
MTEQELLERLKSSGRGDEMLARIEKLGFTPAFIVKNVLVAGAPITVAQVAMLWQGMPNKHDRKRTRELLDILTDSGLLSADPAAETWRLLE